MKFVAWFVFALGSAQVFGIPESMKPKRSTQPQPYKINVEERTPNQGSVVPIAVIGTGAAGSMAVKRTLLNNDQVLVFTGAKNEIHSTRGTYVRKVDNVPGWEKKQRVIVEMRDEVLKDAVSGPFAKNLFVQKSSVVRISKTNQGYFQLRDNRGKTFFAQFVILATGMMDRQPLIGEKGHYGVIPYANHQNNIYCARCDGHRAIGKTTAVIGHASAAADNAILLHERYNLPRITILTHGKKPQWGRLKQRLLNRYRIEVKTASIENVLGENGQLEGFVLAGKTQVPAKFSVTALGVHAVYNDLAKQLNAHLDERGFILIDKHGETSVPGLFAAGDVTSGSMKQIYSGWEQAVLAADTANHYIRSAQRQGA